MSKALRADAATTSIAVHSHSVGESEFMREIVRAESGKSFIPMA
jgi:hypothetical protein